MLEVLVLLQRTGVPRFAAEVRRHLGPPAIATAAVLMLGVGACGGTTKDSAADTAAAAPSAGAADPNARSRGRDQRR